jgi:hypothetical protein
VKASEEVGTIVHAFSDQERKDSVRLLAARVRRLEHVVEIFAERAYCYDTCSSVLGNHPCDCGHEEAKKVFAENSK